MSLANRQIVELSPLFMQSPEDACETRCLDVLGPVSGDCGYDLYLGTYLGIMCVYALSLQPLLTV